MSGADAKGLADKLENYMEANRSIVEKFRIYEMVSYLKNEHIPALRALEQSSSDDKMKELRAKYEHLSTCDQTKDWSPSDVWVAVLADLDRISKPSEESEKR